MTAALLRACPPPHAKPGAMRAALLVLGCQGADLASWLLAVQRWGTGPESNPLAVAAGPELVVVVKVAGAFLLAALAWRLAPSRWALLPAVVGIAGALTNLVALA